MMKQPRFATKSLLSRTCQWVLAIGLCKVGLLGTVLFLSFNDHSGVGELGAVTAHAAEIAPIAVPPAPQVRGQRQPSPFAQQPDYARPTLVPLPNNLQNQAAPLPQHEPRPDQPQQALAPAPRLDSFVPQDSAQRRQEELNRREQELLTLQQQMQSRLEELHTLEGRISGMLQDAGNIQDEKLKHLIDVYSNMKAKKAAQVLATLDESIAVKILAGMRSKQAGQIFSYMAAEPAAVLSELLSKTQLQ